MDADMDADLALELDGLRLVPPTDDDADAVAAAVQASIDELAPWMPWATAEYDRVSALQWVRGEIDPTSHRFAIVVDDEIVGSCGLNKLDAENQRMNLGYWVRSDRVGRGHATAATKLLADYGLNHVGMRRLEVLMSVRNEASRRVAERAGAHYEGVAVARLLLNGESHDAHMFSFS